MSTNQFKPAWWLPTSHLQTLWPAICRSEIKNLSLSRERIELPDGDFIDLDWCDKERKGPTVLILHGFEGSISSHYAKGMMAAIRQQGWRGVFMHFRGCSGEPNRLPRGYHSGETKDVDYIVNLLAKREDHAVIAAIGYSLGGNVLLKWLGETAENNPLTAAVAISVPLELHKAAARIEKGFSRFYQWYLIKCARKRLLKKFEEIPHPFDFEMLSEIEGLKDLDGKYTVPLHGFTSIDEYYTTASSRQYLRNIQVPTLLVQAKDDPFMTEDVIPTKDEVSAAVTLEVTETGGHVGFIGGNLPWRPHYWLEERIPAYLKAFFK